MKVIDESNLGAKGCNAGDQHRPPPQSACWSYAMVREARRNQGE
jgi:hypothetical protein